MSAVFPGGRWALALAIVGSLMFGGCRGDGGTSTPTSTPTATAATAATATATVPIRPTPSPEEEVEEAYLDYWEAYADAVLNLDASLVEGFATGEELERLRAEVETLESDGVAVRVVVEHDMLVTLTSDTAGTVIDEVTNNSFYVDATTKEPSTAPGTGEVLRNTFFLERIDGRWMVTRGVREGS